MIDVPSQRLIEKRFEQSRQRSVRRHNRFLVRHAKRRQRWQRVRDFFSTRGAWVIKHDKHQPSVKVYDQ